MKWIRYLIVLLVLLPMLTTTVHGAKDTVQDSFSEEWDIFVESIPEEIRPLANDALYESDGAVELQKTFSLSYFWERVVTGLKATWPSAAELFFSLAGLLIFTALFHRFSSAVSSEALNTAGELCSTLCLVLCITPVIQSSAEISEEFLTLITSCTGGITPVICALLVSTGNITTAAVANAMLMLVYTLFQSVIQVFLWPIVRLVYVMGIVGNLGGHLHFDSISRWIRRLFTWILSLMMVFLSVVFGIQGTMAVSTDSFSIKTAKFALGNFIPLVGNALSDAVGTVAGSLSLIKNTCGAFGLITVALLLLPVILHLLIHRIVIGAARGMAELLGCEREGRLLGEMYASLGYILAIVALVSALFIFILSLIISVRF